MSIEQLQPFHQTRRLLKAIAPEFRLLANPALEANASVLDIKTKTIEVGEATEVYRAVAIMLFNIGHLLLLKDPSFDMFFGQGFVEWNGTSEELIDALSDLGVKADDSASRWAVEVLKAYFPVADDIASQHVESCRWSKIEWADYFGA